MAFSDNEKNLLLAVKGVGHKVIERLEQQGIDSLEELAKANASDITKYVAALLGSSCWKNSPQALAAIYGAIDMAKGYVRANKS